jgi:hypothetical protein
MSDGKGSDPSNTKQVENAIAQTQSESGFRRKGAGKTQGRLLLPANERFEKRLVLHKRYPVVSISSMQFTR